jgi:hypothetical protein
MQTYRLFVDSDTLYSRIPASIGAAREYARFLIRCVSVPATERYAIASAYGWPSEDVSDDVKHDEYQSRRAVLLFPSAAQEIAKRADAVNVEEVARAEANFTKATGIQLRAPAVSFDDLSTFLTQALSSTSQIQLNQVKQE